MAPTNIKQMMDQMLQDHAQQDPEFQKYLDSNQQQDWRPDWTGGMGTGMPEVNVANDPQFRSQSGASAHDIEVAKHKELLDQLEAAQQADRHQASADRVRSLSTRAGQAVSNQMGHLPLTETGPLPEMPSQAKAAGDRIKLGEEMKQDLFKRENPEDERLMKWLINNNTNTTHKEVADKQIEAKAEEDKTNRDFKKKERVAHEGFSADQGDKNRAAGLVRPIVAAQASQSQQGAKQDAQFANDQAERQLVGRIDITPHSATDKSTQSVTDGSLRSVEKVGGQAIAVMRKYGANFPQSTEWKKLESTMMDLNQEVNHLHHNGVMNFNDKDNNKQEIGDPQAFLQFMAQNGPDVLEHALKNLHTNVDQQAMSHGYGPLDDKNWKPKAAKDYMGQSSGGGKSKSGPLQDPNNVKAMIDSVNKGTPMPNLRDADNSPIPDPKTVEGMRGGSKGKSIKWVPGKGAVIE